MAFSGKIAFITGGARGLGKCIGKGILEGGGKVVLVDVLETLGQHTASELSAQYGQTSVHFIHCDVANKAKFQDSFEEAINMFGTIDIMINNAAVITHENFEVTVGINLTAIIHGSFLAVEHMRKDKGGKGGVVINISSVAGIIPFSPNPVYTATKHGVVGLSRSLGEGVANQGVTVMCLCPVSIQTPMLDKALEIATDKEAVVRGGFIQVEDAFKAVEVLIKDNIPGSVMVVSPEGTEYKFPNNAK